MTLDGPGLRFVGELGSGHRVVLDDGDGDTGPRPAELVPLALASCTAMDVISILRKKRQSVSSYVVRASGTQLDAPPHMFTRIDVVHEVEGDVDVEAVRRSIDLSATRYCSVAATLSSGAVEVHHAYLVRDAAGREQRGEVVVLGPNQPAAGTTPAAEGVSAA